jgi:hypothetical protein
MTLKQPNNFTKGVGTTFFGDNHPGTIKYLMMMTLEVIAAASVERLIILCLVLFKAFSHVDLLNPFNNQMRKVFLLSPFNCEVT